MSPSTATLVFAAGLVSIYAIVSGILLQSLVSSIYVSCPLHLSTGYIQYKGRRFRTAADIPNSYFEKGRKIRGVVKAVNDGDNIRIRHTTWLRRSPHLPPGTMLCRNVTKDES